MNLPEAKEILTDIAKQAYFSPGAIEFKAIQLGIEALREVERLRPHIHYHVQQLLPGETKD